MSSVRLEVQWSPVHPDKFITWGTEICLYETVPMKEYNKSSYTDLSDTSVAHLLATNSTHHYLKCVDIYPKEEPDVLLAVGQANGKVVLTTFGQTMFDTQGLAGLELVPKHPRQCNVVMWNKVDSNLIAAGLDRYRTDHCVMVWDTSLGRSTNTVAEMGLSDAAHSLAWLYNQPRSLIVGMNNKHLKMVDLRDSSKAVNSSPTKAVHGLSVCPHNDHLLASYVDAQIAIWDTRSFDKPALTLTQSKPITKLLWCPTRHNLLTSLQRDSRSIHLLDVQQSVDDSEPSVLERCVKPGTSSHITSFSWHPKHENRLLILTLQGSLTDFHVAERMTLNWGQTSHIIWTQGRKVLRGINEKHPVYLTVQDITVEMKKRALQGYGLKQELKSNGDLIDDEELKELWNWLHHSKTLVNEGTIETTGTCQHPGVRSVLGLDATSSVVSVRSETVFCSWMGLNSNNSAVKIYRSETRDKALYLCGWRFVHDVNAFQQAIEELEREGRVTKAAALAVFSLRLRQGIKTLSADPKHNTVAMALSGYTDDRNSMWRESCVASRAQITDPYLRAIFAFLTAENDNYDAVLYDSGMSISDRVGFALTFLSDIRLAEFINRLTDFLSGSGHLSGFLLTGVSQEAISLLQRYIDHMGDIQSVSVIVMRSFPPELLDNEKVSFWLNGYRELLDSWRLWSQRAQFDIWLNRRAGTRPEPQIFISCNFCGKSMSTQSLQRSKSPYPRIGGTSSNQTKVSCCPNCRKPQPRCSICLVNMGTASCYIPESPSSPSGEKSQVNPFDYWFTWCQTCRHGGHAAHMTQWFKEHSECPVTACSCRCPSLDASSNVPSISSQS